MAVSRHMTIWNYATRTRVYNQVRQANHAILAGTMEKLEDAVKTASAELES